MKKKHDTTNKTVPSNTMVFISNEINFSQISKDTPSHLEIIKLRHPRTEKSTNFMYDSDKGTIQEILKFSEMNRSWFIGDTVVSEGNVHLVTPVDPLFLILPYLNKNKMFSTLDQLIHDDEYNDSAKLECLVDEDQLSLISYKKDCSGLIVWKYSEEKTLQWLKTKVIKVANILEQKNINVNSECAVSKTFVRTVKESQENYLRYAHGIISEYLKDEISEKLLVHLNLPSVKSICTKKRKNNELDSEEIKKLRKDYEKDKLNIDVLQANTQTEKTTKKNSKHVALAKAAAGTKNISSFFKKK